MAADPRDVAGQPRRDSAIPGRRRGERVAAAVLVIAALAIAGAFAWQQRHAPIPVAGPAAQEPAVSTPIGAIDVPQSELIVATAVRISGWALDSGGIRGVEIRVDGKSYPARYGIARPDVAQAKAGYPDSAASGFAFEEDFAPLSAQRHELVIVAVNRAGKETVLGRKGLVPPAAFDEWRALYAARRAERIPSLLYHPRPLRHWPRGCERARHRLHGVSLPDIRGWHAGPDPVSAHDPWTCARLGFRPELEHRATLRREAHRRGLAGRDDGLRHRAQAAGPVHAERRHLGERSLRRARLGHQRSLGAGRRELPVE